MPRALILLILLACSPLQAANPLPDTESELIDVWGAVLYCRAIYEEPDVQDRIYQGDRDACQQAHRTLGMHVLDTFPEEQSRTVFEHARHKAAVIRYNTRSIQEAIPACRELCRGYGD